VRGTKETPIVFFHLHKVNESLISLRVQGFWYNYYLGCVSITCSQIISRVAKVYSFHSIVHENKLLCFRDDIIMLGSRSQKSRCHPISPSFIQVIGIWVGQVSFITMPPWQKIVSQRGGANNSTSLERHLFSSNLVATLFNLVPMEIRKEIWYLESREFGDKPYFSDSEVGVQHIKWIPNLGKLKRRKLHFLHSIVVHQQLDTLFHLVLWDKKVVNYKFFFIRI